MPFKSKRQQRAAFAGAIPGISKAKAREWAHETRDIKKLPERAAAEKGKRTLRSKTSNHAAIQRLLYAWRKADANGAIDTRGVLDALTSPTAAQNTRNLYNQEAESHSKDAALIRIGTKLALSIPGAGAIRVKPNMVGRFPGQAGKTRQALQPPGPTLSPATKPNLGISTAMKPPAERNALPKAPAT
jgi:hypothetical protein